MHGTITPLDRAKSSAHYIKSMSDINNTIESFITTGIAIIRDIDFSQRPDIDDSDWHAKRAFYDNNRKSISSPYLVRSFIRRVAKDLKRPIIFATVGGWYTDRRVRIAIKKIKRNQAIVAPFLLTIGASDGSILGYQDKTNWYFNFMGAKGLAVFEKWREQCKTDPEFRRAMKLDTHP